MEDKEEFSKNNDNNNKIIEEKATEQKAIPMDIITSNMRAICKIIIDKKNDKTTKGTGFFIKIKNEKEYYFLITNEHVISRFLVKSTKKDKNKIEIILNIRNSEQLENNIEEKEKYCLNIYDKQRIIICLNRNEQDITAIEILDKDEFKSKVKFLSVDLNYIDGYSQYIGQDVFMLEHPEGKIIHICAGRITNFLQKNNEKLNFDDNQDYYFEHILSTEQG